MLFPKAILTALSIAASANGQVSLGTAAAYGVFGGTTITNTGLTVIGARIGLSPGSSITGFPPGINTGQDINNGAATQAKADIQSAYNVLAGLPSSQDLTGTDLGGRTLLPGVYTFSSSGGLTGTLTLDGGGSSNAQFVFKFGSTITTASASSVVLTNGAQACNVFWQVGSSATFGTGTNFLGNVVARTSITVTTGTSLNRGGFYALDGAVTLDTNSIDPNGACAAPPAVSPTVTSTTPSSTVVVTTPTNTVTTPAASVVTTTTTSTVTNPASTTTITITVPTTVTQTVPASTIKTTSTTTKWSTKPWTKTASATKCPTKATSTKKATSTTKKSSTSSTKAATKTTKAQNYKRAKASTKTRTVTTTCAGYTKTQRATQTAKVTRAYTSTVWQTKQATTTSTYTYYPSCTTNPKAKRDYERMFG